MEKRPVHKYVYMYYTYIYMDQPQQIYTTYLRKICVSGKRLIFFACQNLLFVALWSNFK